MILSFWVCVTRLIQSTQDNKFGISLQYLKENRKNKVDVLLADKYQKFLQTDTIILSVCGQACQITQNNTFVISLQYVKKDVSDEVNFLHADKHESFLQIDDMIFDEGMVKHYKSTQNNKFAISLQYIKENEKNEVFFFACR